MAEKSELPYSGTDELKRCLDCDALKSKSEFYAYVDPKGKQRLRGQCKACTGIRQARSEEVFKKLHNGRSRGVVNYTRKFSPKEASCQGCGGSFIKIQRTHKYCCAKCKDHANLTPTSEQYEKLSGNWQKYFVTLLAQPHRRACGLTVDILQRVFDRQNGLCALSGEPMTCLRKSGVKYKTNASIDRIEAKGSYAEDNIQLVCVAVNKFRIDMDIEEYINWCRKVAYNADKKKNV